MKQVLALPFLLFANAAVADDMAQQFQLHLNSDLDGAGSTVKATVIGLSMVRSLSWSGGYWHGQTI